MSGYVMAVPFMALNRNKMDDRAKSDGVMTKKERARIVAAQDRASRHIAREKHDRQGRRHR
jgi:hypothetical protein